MFLIWSEGFGTERDSIELALFFTRSQHYYNTAEVSVAAWKAKSVLKTVLEARML
ncbi:hypothetical protein HETIRDRAFT_422703 [Heterobasidion irregulare TC 32-1]|uniref:Uncharacterized protein n=1 Tax=Heterobasidion irregulare (strain TC 32-1) TaxID=747525 RepID=W4JRB3_HETIT|nr:uncharacterized protein HETIRDRAFT_422703 [Heterobasidion irregulare TC 32-1]ETW76112.1 hypothetical protein HETIRDRAFT_422703 [Heterobasidion irregulare TC 32-1]